MTIPLDEQSTTPRREPTIVYWVYFTYGVAMLLPWNVFITASDYFSYRFQGTSYESNFQNYFSAYSNVSNLLSLTLFLWLRQSKYMSNVDVLIPLFINLVIFLFFTVTSWVSSIPADLYFWFTVFCMSIAGVTTSLLQLTVFEDASQLGPKYMQAVMSGQGMVATVSLLHASKYTNPPVGIAGVSVALFSLAMTVFDGDGTFFYFACALLVTLSSMLGRVLLQNKKSNYHQVNSDIDLSLDNHTEPVLSLTTVIQRSSIHIFIVIYIYVITLAVFPAVTVQIISSKPTVYISLHFLIFNLGDWIGRTLPIWKACQVSSDKVMMAFVILRTLFIPVFMLYMVNDMVFYMCVMVLAMSNGWLTSVVFMVAPSSYTMKSKPLVASVMSYSLVIGLAFGGLASFLLT